jgi:hypothetical protein
MKRGDTEAKRVAVRLPPAARTGDGERFYLLLYIGRLIPVHELM